MKQKTKLIFILLFLMFLPIDHVFGREIKHKDSVDTFFKANEEYQAAQKAMSAEKKDEAIEKFKNATQLYEQLLESNFINGQIYYNLGNTYYKQGISGKAMLSYRRAEQLLPRNADIKANINLLKSDFIDKEATVKAPEFLKLALFWYFFLNLNEITHITMYMYFALMASIISVIFLKFQWLRKLSIIFASCLLVLVISLGIKAYGQYSVERGIVIVDECKVRYGPGEEYEPKFEIHEGAEIKIEEERDKWYKVHVYVDIEDTRDDEENKDSEFEKGWIQKDKFEKI